MSFADGSIDFQVPCLPVHFIAILVISVSVQWSIVKPRITYVLRSRIIISPTLLYDEVDTTLQSITVSPSMYSGHSHTSS